MFTKAACAHKFTLPAYTISAYPHALRRGGLPAIADMLSVNYEPLPMRKAGTLQQGSIAAAMPKAQSGGMGMLPILHTCQALQVKAVAAGRNVRTSWGEF